MSMIGAITMPVNFRYRDVFLKGKPRHDRCDAFRSRHPSMDVSRRAKIFAPFDALKGFNEAVAAKDVLYRDKAALSEEDAAELNRRLEILHGLTYNSRMARANHVQVTVTYYEACSDVNHEDFALRGQYKTISGICYNVDAEVTKSILVGVARAPRPQAPHAPRTEIDRMRIYMENIRRIDGPEELFRTDRIEREET